MPLPGQYAASIDGVPRAREPFATQRDNDQNGVTGVMQRMSSSDMATLGLICLIGALCVLAAYSLRRAARESRSLE